MTQMQNTLRFYSLLVLIHVIALYDYSMELDSPERRTLLIRLYFEKKEKTLMDYTYPL